MYIFFPFKIQQVRPLVAGEWNAGGWNGAHPRRDTGMVHLEA